MNNEEKKKYLEHLASNEAFAAALEKAPDESEREKIRSFAQDVFLNMIESLREVGRIVKENPEKVADVLAKRIPKE